MFGKKTLKILTDWLIPSKIQLIEPTTLSLTSARMRTPVGLFISRSKQCIHTLRIFYPLHN